MTLVERLNAIANKLGGKSEATTIQQAVSNIEHLVDKPSRPVPSKKNAGTTQKTEKPAFSYSDKTE